MLYPQGRIQRNEDREDRVQMQGGLDLLPAGLTGHLLGKFTVSQSQLRESVRLNVNQKYEREA